MNPAANSFNSTLLTASARCGLASISLTTLTLWWRQNWWRLTPPAVPIASDRRLHF